MKTIFLTALVSINGDAMQKTFQTALATGTQITPAWLYEQASRIADRYLDAGQVCVSDIEVLDTAASAIDLDAPTLADA